MASEVRAHGRRWAVTGTAVLVAAVVGLVLVLTGGRADWLEPERAAAPTSDSSTTPTTSATSPPAEPDVPPALRGLDVETIPTTERVVALTFDAGGNAAGLESILATLAAKNVRGTFFLTGRWADANPDGVAAIAAGGHRLGNHSVTHPAFTTLSDATIRDEVRGAEASILAAGGDPRPLFRFPLGDRDARTIAAVNDLGYVPVRWTVDTLGWQGTSGGRSVASVRDRAVGALQPGEIVLMHVGSHPDDGSTLDADALPEMIDAMRAAGYTFVSLDALVRP